MLWADPPRQVSPEGSTGEKTQKSMQMHVFAIYPDCFPFFLFSLFFFISLLHTPVSKTPSHSSVKSFNQVAKLEILKKATPFMEVGMESENLLQSVLTSNHSLELYYHPDSDIRFDRETFPEELRFRNIWTVKCGPRFNRSPTSPLSKPG